MAGIFFHRKIALVTHNDGYQASGSITLPSASTMLSDSPTFVAYAQLGCFGSDGKNFDAGLQVYGKGWYKLILNGGAVLERSWYEGAAFNTTGTKTLTVKLEQIDANSGKVVVSFGDKSISLKFAANKWKGIYSNGVRFSKEMTIAVGTAKLIDMWSSANIGRTKNVNMSNMTFGEVKILRHSTSTPYILDGNCVVETTSLKGPILEGTGAFPSSTQLQYTCSPTEGSANQFSIVKCA